MLYNILILINISVIDKKKSFIFESHIINITMLLTFYIYNIFRKTILIFNFLNEMLYIFSYEYMSTKIHPCRYYIKVLSKILKFRIKKKYFQ